MCKGGGDIARKKGLKKKTKNQQNFEQGSITKIFQAGQEPLKTCN